ncbi:hypothetical protein [Cuneatibacter sp. NSJ-177]
MIEAKDLLVTVVKRFKTKMLN